MKFQISLYILLSVFCTFFVFPVDAETVKHTMEGSVDLQITYPDSVIVGRTFSVSVLIENNGWEDKQDISLKMVNPDGSIIPTDKDEISTYRLSTKGSYGGTIDFKILPDASIGTNYLNILYSQILVKNNIEPQNPVSSNIAIPIVIKDQPKVTIHTTTPETIFPNAEFPFEVEIISHDIDLKKVNVTVIPPKNIIFQGESTHSFSSIQKDIPVSIISQIKTPEQDLTTEHRIPFEVVVSYTDDTGDEKIDSDTIQLILRPRTFMEITTNGGIWIGDLFIAPYVSIGTIIGIPAGTLFSLIIKRSLEKKKRKRK